MSQDELPASCVTKWAVLPEQCVGQVPCTRWSPEPLGAHVPVTRAACFQTDPSHESVEVVPEPGLGLGLGTHSHYHITKGSRPSFGGDWLVEKLKSQNRRMSWLSRMLVRVSKMAVGQRRLCFGALVASSGPF